MLNLRYYTIPITDTNVYWAIGISSKVTDQIAVTYLLWNEYKEILDREIQKDLINRIRYFPFDGCWR